MAETMRAEIGYALSSEEHEPRALVEYAVAAERAGFRHAFISDHFHPWTTKQGQSPFVWTVLGAIANATERLELATGVTCPIQRIHPAVLAQAAATTAALMPGRFAFGVGTGEQLNEHIVGGHWPPVEERMAMLEEAVALIRELWGGEEITRRSEHFVVEDARIFTRPDTPPPILVAAAGKKSAELAGRIGDGLVSVAPKREVVETFEQAGGAGKPRYGQVTVCYAPEEEQAKKIALEWWPNAAVPGELSQELRLPKYFEQASELVTADAIAETITCGPDPDRHRQAIQQFVDAGFDHVYVHQVGPDQDGFFAFYEREVLPAFSG